MAPQWLKRKRFLLDRFQYRLLALNLIYFFTILMVTAGFLFIPLMVKLDSSGLSLVEQEEVASLILSLHTRLWPAMAIVFVLLAIHSVATSHRIAGALYRFRKVFDEVAGGNLTVRATLRKKDYLDNEAASINRMIEGLGARVTGLSEECAALQATLAACAAKAQGGSPEELTRGLARAEAQVGQLKRRLEEFTLGGGKGGRA